MVREPGPILTQRPSTVGTFRATLSLSIVPVVCSKGCKQNRLRVDLEDLRKYRTLMKSKLEARGSLDPEPGARNNNYWNRYCLSTGMMYDSHNDGMRDGCIR